ncbi:MAG: prolyl oligopeptidase family serine peptidase, partial [Planctomycetaceae bacterium]|nr:prolyl oligopeptidase family serine peptidase [Planctomycetaceae bacterium]
MLFYQKHLVKFTSAFLFCLTLLPSLTKADGPKDNIPDEVRRIPALGVEVPAEQKQQLEQGLAKLKTSLDQLKKSKDARIKALIPDVEIYYRAVWSALEYQEFFHEREIGTGLNLLKQGQERADQLLKGEAPWTQQTGLVVRGYISKIDQTVQPYGLVIPDNYTFSGKSEYRCDLWFHGRGERLSEVNFINQQQRSRGQYTPANTIVLHPYGRYSNAFKFAGEVDVLEALESTRQNYRIDDDRISVRGFSMGGAACWQFAVHYADRWFAANPGAGFSETPLFLKVFQEEKLKPTWYEEKLWQLYDCPGYALNLFQCPTVAYSGEIDKQKQAADVMELALKKVGIDMVHIIGPDTAHKIHPDSKVIIEEKMDSLARIGRQRVP